MKLAIEDNTKINTVASQVSANNLIIINIIMTHF